MSERMESALARIVDTLTGGGLPWVARIYFLLIVLFGAVLIWSAAASHQVSPDKLVESDLYVRLFTLSSDGMKTVLGALLGSLSLAAEAIWKDKSK